MLSSVEVGMAEVLPLAVPPRPAMSCSAWACSIPPVRAARRWIYVSAYMLFNLAAMRGSIEAKVYRKELSQEMDPGDVAEAQKAARNWLQAG